MEEVETAVTAVVDVIREMDDPTSRSSEAVKAFSDLQRIITSAQAQLVQIATGS